PFATVAGSHVRIRWRVNKKSMAVLVGAIEPPVEAVKAGADRGDVARAAYGTLLRQHLRLAATRHRGICGNRTVNRRINGGRLKKLFIFPATMPKIEQTETG